MFGHNQRKHFFIDKALQSRYVFYIVATLFTLSLASAVSIYFGVWGSVVEQFDSENTKNRMDLSTRLREYEEARLTEGMSQELTLSLIKEVDLFAAREREILNEILSRTYQNLYPLVFALLFFIGWGSIFITHKVAGPLFRLESSFKKLAEGRLDFRIQLRKHDEGKNLVPHFNAFLENLDQSLTLLKRAAQKLTERTREKSCPPECLEIASQICEELDKYQTSGGRPAVN